MSRRGIALCAVLALSLGSCDRAQQGGAAQDALPPGAWLYGDADALRITLGAIVGLRGTQAARLAEQARQRIAACSTVVSHTEQPLELLGALRCAEAGETLPAALLRLRGDASLAWSIDSVARDVGSGLPAQDLPPLQGTASVAADGAINARLSFVPVSSSSSSASSGGGAGRGLSRLIVPGERSAGPARLAAGDSLIHARLRPADGLDVASGVAAGGQADRLFQLGSALFTGAALAGSWELAVYPPQPGQALPPMALGLELALPNAARAGVARFVADLEAAWPIEHREARFEIADGADGAARRELRGSCFFELRILPEFAPCWVIDADLLVVGWNGASLERALSTGALPGAPLDGAVLALDRWPAAEQALGGAGPKYPWSRIEIGAERAAGSEQVVLALRAEVRSQP